jgi:hypothetical protein
MLSLDCVSSWKWPAFPALLLRWVRQRLAGLFICREVHQLVRTEGAKGGARGGERGVKGRGGEGEHLLLQLCIESSGGIVTQFSFVVDHVHARTHRIESDLQCQFGFGVDYGQRHWVEVCAHAVHTEADHAEFLFAPAEGPVEVAHLLPSAILSARHVLEEMLRGEAQAGYTFVELMVRTYGLMLLQVERVILVIVAFNELGEAEGFGKAIHLPSLPSTPTPECAWP